MLLFKHLLQFNPVHQNKKRDPFEVELEKPIICKLTLIKRKQYTTRVMVPLETRETQYSNDQQQKLFELQPHDDQISAPIGETKTKKLSPSSLMAPEVLSGREKLKRHRMEVAGHVWIPDLWGQEELLKEWIDCSVFDSQLFPNGLNSARAALVEEGRKVLLNNNCGGGGGGILRNNIDSSSRFRYNNGIKSTAARAALAEEGRRVNINSGGGLRLMDCSSFDSSIYPNRVLKSARAALIEEGRRANSSGGLRI